MRTALLLAAVSIISVSTLSSDPAHAQAFRTWVSGVGDDANPCSRTAPCKTFAGAISKTANGGIINCMDPSGFGFVTITKSITIDCTETFGGILAADTNGINVNGAGANVILRGLDIEGAGTGLTGINFIQGASLQVEKCNIYGFQSGAAQGIAFVPSGSAHFFVTDTKISHNGTGIFIDPVAGTVLTTMQRVQLNKNYEGFRASGASAGQIFANVQDSLASMNGTNGFVAVSRGAGVILDIQRSSSNLNGGAGVQADGAGASVFIGSSMVTANGLGFSQTSSGVIRSYGNNAVDNNTINGAATGPAVPLM